MSDDGTLLQVGTRAPEFSAAASDGRTHELGALLARGDVALFFYPGNNTPG
jgi:peroxiredoxin